MSHNTVINNINGKTFKKQKPNCSEVMDSRISSFAARSERLAEVDLVEVAEKAVIEILNVIWLGSGTSSSNDCSILCWNMDVPIPQLPLNDVVDRIAFHLSVPSFQVLLGYSFLLLHGKLKKGIAQHEVSVLVATPITPKNKLSVRGVAFKVVDNARSKLICRQPRFTLMPQIISCLV